MTKSKDGIVQDERGQDQPADKQRAQQFEKTDQGFEPASEGLRRERKGPFNKDSGRHTKP